MRLKNPMITEAPTIIPVAAEVVLPPVPVTVICGAYEEATLLEAVVSVVPSVLEAEGSATSDRLMLPAPPAATTAFLTAVNSAADIPNEVAILTLAVARAELATLSISTAEMTRAWDKTFLASALLAWVCAADLTVSVFTVTALVPVVLQVGIFISVFVWKSIADGSVPALVVHAVTAGTSKGSVGLAA